MRNQDNLCSLIDSSDADIVVLTETWLSHKIQNNEILNTTKQFNIYRQDRTDRTGGGVLIAISDHIDSFCVRVVANIEIICVGVTLNFKKIILIACYRPPSCTSSFVNDLHDVINMIVVRFPGATLLVLGDFNYPTIHWSNVIPFSKPFSPECDSFLNLISDFALFQMITQPTRITSCSASILDLVLTTSVDLMSPITFLPGLSDHALLHFDLQLSAPHVLRHAKYIRDYGKADFTSINNELCLFLDDYTKDFDLRSVEANWTLFKETVTRLTNTYIPLRTLRSTTNSPWFTATHRRLSNKKKRLFRSAKRSGCVLRWEAYQCAAEAYKSAVDEAKRNFCANTLPKMLTENPKKFWNIINPDDKLLIKLMYSDGTPIPIHICASVLNDTFVKSFSCASISTNPDLPPTFFLPMDPIIIDSEGITALIENLKLSSSSGVDGVNSKFLKNTKIYSSIILSMLFHQSLLHGCLPEDWKVGKVIPLHKTGDAHCPNNYRPISLTSVPCKVLEHIIYSNIVNFLESNSFFYPAQHGFRKSFSCETQLLSFTNDLHIALDRGSQVDCIFLDFSKAFDKVSHKLLFLKLDRLNMDANVLAWIKCFLNNRSQFVQANGTDSFSSPVNSGVPQGSVLGPLLFLIYINDLPDCVSSSISLFADDCVIYREIANESDTSILQSDINALSNWCTLWHMELNTNKCKAMRVSRQYNPRLNYAIQNVSLESVSSYKYLGVHIAFNLSWKTHIEYVTNNANRMLGYIKRNFSLAPASLKLLLYTTLVRSKLEYASSIWDPGQETLIYTLERVQNRSARFISSNYHRTASVTSMKITLSLPDLIVRRLISRLCLFHKIYHLNPSLRNKLLTPPDYISPRVDHPYKVNIPSCHTNVFSKSFLPSTALAWNRLPHDIASITDNNAFRNAIFAHFCRP